MRGERGWAQMKLHVRTRLSSPQLLLELFYAGGIRDVPVQIARRPVDSKQAVQGGLKLGCGWAKLPQKLAEISYVPRNCTPPDVVPSCSCPVHVGKATVAV